MIELESGGSSASDAVLTERRRAALRASGLKQAELAARIGVSRQSVGLVLAGHHRSRHVEQAIADAAGVPVEDLFPPAVGAAPPAGRELPGDATRIVGGTVAVAGQLQVPPPLRAGDLERRVADEVRRIAQDVFLAIAEGALRPDAPIVRAAAAALRELER
jgi:transcriptional regulator with XRE-family HTH domain